jgi:hypothetical protein
MSSQTAPRHLKWWTGRHFYSHNPKVRPNNSKTKRIRATKIERQLRANPETVKLLKWLIGGSAVACSQWLKPLLAALLAR